MKITEITPDEAKTLIAQDGILILDARRPSNYVFYVTENGKPVKFQKENLDRNYAGSFEKALCFCWPDRGYRETAMILAKMGVKEVFAVRGAPTF